jgi:D-sedoheptulose 7-phosphate isomerase
MSTSGKSVNVVRAVELAQSWGIFTAALVGSDAASLSGCDAVITVDADDLGTVQECHMLMIHSLVRLIEEFARRGPEAAGTSA